MSTVSAPPARFENLEPRRFLSATLNNGILTVIGTNAADRIDVIRRNDDNQIRVELNGQRTVFRIGDVTRIHVSGLRGSDAVVFSARDGGLAFPSNISGGKGNDTVVAGHGDDTISGGTGHDRIFGLAGDDLLTGDNGNDFIEGASGEDTLRGGAGHDDLSGGRHRDFLLGGDGDDDMSGGRDIDTIWGNAGDDDFDSDPVLEIKDYQRGDRGNNLNL